MRERGTEVEKESFCSVRVDYTSSRGSTRGKELVIRIDCEKVRAKGVSSRGSHYGVVRCAVRICCSARRGDAEEVTARGADVHYSSPLRECVMYLRGILRNVRGAG